MLALARYTLKGPYYAAAVVAVLAILSVFIPLVSSNIMGALVAMLLTFVSGGLVGLIILTQGIQSGLKAIVASILGITAIAAVVLKAPALGVSIGLVQWLPIVILAQTFRLTNSIALTLLAGVVLGSVAVVTQFLVWPNLETDLAVIVQQSLTQLSQGQMENSAELGEHIRRMVHWMILAMNGSMYVLIVLIVLLARWMQARLKDSDGFQREFLSLSLGKPAGILALIMIALSYWLVQDWLTALAILISAAFLFQGIAVVIDRFIRKSRSKGLLFALFIVLLLVVPFVGAITIVTGIVDNWLSFRRSENSGNMPD